MAKVVLDVKLTNGVNKKEFVDSFDPDTQADWWNMLDNIPCCICMHVEESFLDIFRQDSRVISADERLEAFPSSLPSAISTTKIVTASTPPLASNGGDYMPLQMYVDTDYIYPTNPGEKIGKNETYDGASSIPNATHVSKWTGKNVDIVTVEVGPVDSQYAGDHDTHPDFDDPDNAGTSRVIPMDWNSVAPSITEPSNIQVTSNSLFSSHAMGVLSAAGGTICGFAKRSSLRVIYITGDDGATEVIDAVIAWHNAKPNNPTTGVPNPTIMIGEFQYLQDRIFGIPIDYIESVTTPDGTISRPGSSWGTNFTPFIKRNIVPFAMLNPDTGTYEWCVVMPTQGKNLPLRASTDSAWDAGVIFINGAGNNGGVYVKENEVVNYSLSVDATAPYTTYIISPYQGISVSSSSLTLWYPFNTVGPHGSVKAIDVAAGYNSEGIPGLDSYSNRGPGIDIVGLGADTWTAYPSQAYSDGFRWGMFSGTSCAAPTVVGKAACEIEKYYYFNSTWPTPDEIKSILRSNGRELIIGVESTNWSNVPVAGSSISNSMGGGLVRISNANGNGQYNFSDLVGTTRIRAHFSDGDANNTEESKELPLARTNRYRRRPSDNPVKAVIYPRRKLKFTSDVTLKSPRDDLPSST